MTECLEKSKEKPNFSFLDLSDPNSVRFLFDVMAFLRFDTFQERYLEPFNLKFPHISLDQAPGTVKILDFMSSIPNLSLFRKPYDPNQAMEIEFPFAVRELRIGSGTDISGVDFRWFRNLEKLHLIFPVGCTVDQINRLPSSLKELFLSGTNVQGIDFTRFQHIESVFLDHVTGLSAQQINSFSPDLKELRLLGVSVSTVNFSHFQSMETLILTDVQGLSVGQIQCFPSTLKVVRLLAYDISGGDVLSVMADLRARGCIVGSF